MKLEKLKLKSIVLSKENMNTTFGGKMAAGTVGGTACDATGSGQASDCCGDLQAD
jgi:hypothetical protein